MLKNFTLAFVYLGIASLVSWELATRSPLRFVLTVGPILILAATLWFAALGTLRVRDKASLALLGGCVALTVLYSRTWVEVPNIMKSAIRSEKVWSITLQNPSQVLRRVVPHPNIGSAKAVRVRVALEDDYRGPSFLTATVHGDDFGTMFPEGTQRGLSLGHDSLELIFDASALDGLDFVEIDLRQPIPDAALRVVVIGEVRGAVLGENSAFFGDGFRWLRGVPVATTGMIASGLPQVWLDGVY